VCADQLYLADYNCSSRVVDESRDIVFRHGHTRVVPLFVTTHEHFGIQLNLFDLFDSRITVVHAVTGPRCRLEAGVTKCNTGRAVELEAVRGPRAGGGGATFEQQQALDPDVSSVTSVSLSVPVLF